MGSVEAGINLFGFGGESELCAAILQHSDVGTTLAWYIQTPEAESKTRCRS